MSIEWDLAEQLAALRAKILRGQLREWQIRRLIAALTPELSLITQVEAQAPADDRARRRTLTLVK